MGRIAEDELERIKREIALERLVEARGVALMPRGSDLVGLCPFHEDHEPSLVITPDKNLWHCLGACDAGGSVIDWVMRSEGLSFRHAVEWLRTDHSALVAQGPIRRVKHCTVRRLPPPVSMEAEDHELLAQVVDYYHETLKQSSEALAYLKGRGLESSEMIERFKMGYANRTLGYRLPASNRQAGEAIRGRLTKLGILRESGHEHFSGSIVIPILDEQGCVSEMYGRKIHDRLRAGTPYHLYLPGPHRGVWNIEALSASSEIILCEALMDALTFWCAGYRNVTASYGVNGFTGDHEAAFKRYGVRKVWLAYDRDEAGEKAAEALADQLMAHGMECYRIQFPKGMDANAYALNVQPAEKSLGVLIRHAVWLGKGKTADGSWLAGEKEGGDEGQQGSEQAHDAPEESVTSPPDSPLPSPVSASVSEQDIVMTFGDRRYRIRGLNKNMSYDLLKVNIWVGRDEGFYVDTLDLYSAKARAAYIKQAAMELGLEESVIKKDVGGVLRHLEELQEGQIKAALAPKAKAVVLSESETQAAMDLLKDPKLLDRILLDFHRCGVVGEETNKLVGYLAAISRKLDEPLAVIIQSSTAAGKTALMEAILSFIPPEDRVKYSAMTGQALFYMQDTNLSHKILALVEEEGAERASYALKLLQSEGELMIASTGKDPATGRLVTHEYRVQGPVMIFLTTTAIEVDEELLNRCLILTVDEGRAQTQAIHRFQREKHTLEGLFARQEREAILKRHQNAQRLLRPLCVVNPYARRLTFMDDRTRTRRDHLKYLTLIDAIAFLHQYQRPLHTAPRNGQIVSYIEVTIDDMAVANRLAHEVLGRTLDELPPQTRRLLMLVDLMVRAACARLKQERSDYRFSIREVRQYTGWGHTQLKVHLHRLVELEYLLVHRSDRGQGHVYELLYDGEGQKGEPFLMGLVDVEKLTCIYDEKRSGENGVWSGHGRPSVGAESGGGRGSQNAVLANVNAAFAENGEENAKNAYIGEINP